MNRAAVVIPNWNGADSLRACLDALKTQTRRPDRIIVVDNGSIDNSLRLLADHYPNVHVIKHDTNKGYAGGVNPGLQWAIDNDYAYVAPLNNDAVADTDWLRYLIEALEKNPELGAVACKLLDADGIKIDSTGEWYTHWGLPYPRGRGEADHGQYDAPDQQEIFAASGGASLYRVATLKQVGLLDEDFFAYYEDADLGFRMQLAGWRVRYVPEARVLHATSTTGRRIKGFFTQMTMKNYPMLLIKNVPRPLLLTVLPRFTLAYLSFFASSAQRGQLKYAFKGFGTYLRLSFKKLRQRRAIQRSATVDADYIRSILHWDLPPSADRWRSVRKKYWKLAGKSS